MPYLQHDYLALFRRQPGQTPHGRPLRPGFGRITLKPAPRLKLADDTAQQTAPVIQGPVPEPAQAIVQFVFRPMLKLQQRQKCLLQNVLRLGMAKAQGAPIEQKLLGLVAIKPVLPVQVGHSFTRIDTAMVRFV